MNHPMNRILVVEDNRTLQDNLKKCLELGGFKVVAISSIREAKPHLKVPDCDAVVLDANLPDGDGFELCKEIAECFPKLPVILLTARADEQSVIDGLGNGAVDYIKKPFSMLELIARVQRHLQRRVTAGEGFSVGELHLDPSQLTVRFDDTPIELRKSEFMLLELLARNAGTAVPRERILERLDTDLEMNDRSVDTHIHHLRKKLRKTCGEEVEVETVYGLGYRLTVK